MTTAPCDSPKLKCMLARVVVRCGPASEARRATSAGDKDSPMLVRYGPDESTSAPYVVGAIAGRLFRIASRP